MKTAQEVLDRLQALAAFGAAVIELVQSHRMIRPPKRRKPYAPRKPRQPKAADEPAKPARKRAKPRSLIHSEVTQAAEAATAKKIRLNKGFNKGFKKHLEYQNEVA